MRDNFEVNDEEWSIYGLGNAWCPVLDGELIINGQWASKAPQMFRGSIHSCREIAEDPDSECASADEIHTRASDLSVELFMKNRFFDSSEFDEDPVKEVIQYYFFNAFSNPGQALVFKTREHRLNLQDSMWGYQDYDRSFYSYHLAYQY